MQEILENIALVVIAAMAGEFCLCLLPGGRMRGVCRFAAAIVGAMLLLSIPWGEAGEAWLQEMTENVSTPAPAADAKSYGELIWDVYRREWENRNG